MSEEEKKEKRRLYQSEYYQKNREEKRAKTKKYYHENKEIRAAKDKEYYQKNRERILIEKKEYYQKNKERINKYKKNYEANDPNNKLFRSLRAGLWRTFKTGNLAKNKRTFEILGYSQEDFIKRMALSLKRLNRISKTNYKKSDIGSVLHLEHIVPKSEFNIKSADDPELRRCWSLDNLRLWPAQDFEDKNGNIIQGNLSKGDSCESFQIGF